MMKTSRWLQAAVLATASFFTVGALSPITAATFESAEVTAEKFIAVATPAYSNNQHQLLIIEQISSTQPCWSESGSNPVKVEPLLLNFDFTGICGRSNDSNAYSIRMNGQDLGLDYILRVVKRDGDLLLVGTSRTNYAAPEIEIGRTQGISEGFQKIILNPGWRFTRRSYQGKKLGHIYLTNDSPPPVAQDSNTNPQTLPPSAQPLPADTQPLPTGAQPQAPAPERELIFTKPQAGSATPGGQTPPTDTQIAPSTTTPERSIPVFVVPTTPQAEPTAPGGETPGTSPQTPPSENPSKSLVPVFVVPTK